MNDPALTAAEGSSISIAAYLAIQALTNETFVSVGVAAALVSGTALLAWRAAGERTEFRLKMEQLQRTQAENASRQERILESIRSHEQALRDLQRDLHTHIGNEERGRDGS